jgi:hypothetical protein
MYLSMRSPILNTALQMLQSNLNLHQYTVRLRHTASPFSETIYSGLKQSFGMQQMILLAPGQCPGTRRPLGQALPLVVSTQVPCLSKSRSTSTVQAARLRRLKLSETPGRGSGFGAGVAEMRMGRRVMREVMVKVFMTLVVTVSPGLACAACIGVVEVVEGIDVSGLTGELNEVYILLSPGFSHRLRSMSGTSANICYTWFHRLCPGPVSDRHHWPTIACIMAVE